MNGLNDFSDLNGHTIVMVNDNQQTVDELIEHIFNDVNREPSEVLIVSETLEQCDDERVGFVKGALSSDNIIRKCGLASARKILIWGKDDQESILTTIAASSENPHANIVVKIDHKENEKHFERINSGSDIATISPVNKILAVQELQDKGLSDVVEELLDNSGEATPYAVPNPHQFTIKDLTTRLKGIDPDIKLLAVKNWDGKTTFFPKQHEVVDVVYVIAKERPVLRG